MDITGLVRDYGYGAVLFASMLEGEMKEVAQEETVHTWDYVSPVAITEEYLESMYRCVSSI